MTEQPDPHSGNDDNQEPWMQRLLERPFVLLGAGLFVMFLFYTGWGWYEIYSLPQSPLP